MHYSVNSLGNETLLAVNGELDANTAPELRPVLDAIVADGCDTITVDLSGLRLIDSSGVGALVSLYKRARANGQSVRLTGLADQPLAIFKLLKLDAVFGAA